jgi:glycosyltransferase involved in cell wall biosynthesis
MPLVRRTHPETRLHLVGQSPSPALLAQSDGKSTVVTGTVDDVRPYLARASAVCVPLIAGSGTKYKLLEALSAGAPVVCSPLAVEGLELADEQHLLVAESDEGLATALRRLIDDPPLARRLAAEGRRMVETRYAWDANLPRLDGWLDQMAALPKRHP